MTARRARRDPVRHVRRRRAATVLRLAPAGAVVLAVAVAAGATAAEPGRVPSVAASAAGATDAGVPGGTVTGDAVTGDALPGDDEVGDALPGDDVGGVSTGAPAVLGATGDGSPVRAPSREAAGAPAGPGSPATQLLVTAGDGASAPVDGPTGRSGAPVPAAGAGSATSAPGAPGAPAADRSAPEPLGAGAGVGAGVGAGAGRSPVRAAVVEGSQHLAVSIDSPAAGATLPRGCTVVLAGRATSAAEATVVWTLRSGSTVLQQGPATVEGPDGLAAEIGTTGTWEVMLDLPAGSYTLEVRVPDDSDGEGAGAEAPVVPPVTTTTFRVA
ncbi:Gmad2 immunoglobulin-like domain-containing protein [Pseudokineococcus basanitobsidens]|uniref:Gmad2 immunoglobulin-like domain-containing protein n=1 Tax=Pseudokineococcus basanitobsidens TaxID=1926649 RepID=A0ABU8RKY3_9ACTN